MSDSIQGPDLPEGFDDAPHAVQIALLETYDARDLVEGISAELDIEPPRDRQLQKRHKAAVLLRLRNERMRPTPDAYGEGDLSAEFDTVVEHDAAETEADGGTVAPTPETSVVHGPALRVAVHDAPERITPVQTEPDSEADSDHVKACPECDNSSGVYARETKPDDERWRCPQCEATFPEPQVRSRRDGKAETTADDGDDYEEPPNPPWLARDPHDIISAAPINRTLTDVIAAASGEDDVLQVSRRLSAKNVRSCRQHVLQPLGLVATSGDLVTEDLLDERLSVLGEWVDHE